ncbi:MAG TPA: GNAT family N-acetyltransferase [Steroidobacteraceae bacterium]|nr:GNAT family N-acetyltransferase [Steroidobacteraceae bacterium]
MQSIAPADVDLRPHDVLIRAVGPEYVTDALVMLREAAQWLATLGEPVWSEYDLRKTDLPSHSAAGCLIFGFAGAEPAACMLLQRTDPIYWPRAVEGSALYLHKLAVRRAYAGRGWGPRMITWAKAEARRRQIPRLRLDTFADSWLAQYYVTHGFRVMSRTVHSENGRQMCRMECWLSRK